LAKDPSKTEKATPRRRQKAREEGQVLKSQDVPIAFSLIITSLALIFYMPFVFNKCRDLTYYSLSQVYTLNIQHILFTSVYIFFLTITPLFILLLLTGIFSNVIQFGFIFTSKTLIPKLSNINPISGLRRIFSIKTFFETVKNTLKLSIAILVGYFVSKYILKDFYSFSFMSLNNQIEFLVKGLILLFFSFGLLSIPIAGADFLFRKWEYEENLKMSKEEVKEERKQYEGHPIVKSAIRKRQREIAMKRMMAEVPRADVVITNPTHYAVALKYERGRDRAPKVIAKGVDSIALKIKEIAVENGIFIEENPELARTLYYSCDIGDYIPEELYRVVAKILAKVYRSKKIF
jgi:flagellar biosynthetic protein FlhB